MGCKDATFYSSFVVVLVAVDGDAKRGSFGGNFGYGDTRADSAIVFAIVLFEPCVNKIYFATLYGILSSWEALIRDMPSCSINSKSFCFVSKETEFAESKLFTIL